MALLSRTTRTLSFSTYLGLSACLLVFSCGDDKSVPFVEEEETNSTPTQNGSQKAPEEVVPFEPQVAKVLSPAKSKVTVEGADVDVGTARLHTLLVLDVDGDGDRDVLAVASRVTEAKKKEDPGTTSIFVVMAKRQGDAFALREEGIRVLPAECQLANSAPTSLIRSTQSFAVASAKLTCAEELSAEAQWWISVSASPRLRESLWVGPGTPGASSSVSLTLSHAELDGDRHEDLRANFDVGGVSVPFTWLDRPSGFSRETAEPQATISGLAKSAERALNKKPAEAVALASQAVEVFVTFCRQSGSARVLFGQDAIRCDATESAARAMAVRAAGLAKLGQVHPALEAAESLRDSKGPYFAAANKKSLDLAMTGWPANVKWKKVASHAQSESREVRLNTLVFESEDRLLARGPVSQEIIFSGDAVQVAPVTDAIAPPIRSGDGAFAVLDAQPTCEGNVATVIRADQLTFLVMATQVRALVALQPQETLVPRSGCVKAPLYKMRNGSFGDWTVLGWAPQGLVSAKADALAISPISVAGQPLSPPKLVDATTPLPAPLMGGAITRSGSHYVLPYAQGVLLRDVEKNKSRLLRPKDWFDVPGDPIAVALSPSAKRIAVFKGDSIWVIEPKTLGSK